MEPRFRHRDCPHVKDVWVYMAIVALVGTSSLSWCNEWCQQDTIFATTCIQKRDLPVGRISIDPSDIPAIFCSVTKFQLIRREHGYIASLAMWFDGVYQPE